MKLAIVISTNEPEAVWNGFRLAVTALGKDHQVKVFLLGKGVESDGLQDPKFDIKRQWDAFLSRDGEILACGTCLKLRGKAETATCSVSTMQDLLALIEESDKVVSLG
ncbi:MAG: DsrE family protein [Chloroflexi bacterium]|nr:DsrE family protein [Chloroflexota bacterium]